MKIANKCPITCEIIKNNLTEEEAFYWEEEIIRILVFEYGYSINIKRNRSAEKGMYLVNCTWGGEGASGYKHTKETRRKMSEINSKRWEDEDYRNKMIERLSGENNPNYGKHQTEETKKKNREAHLGRKHSEETKRKIRENRPDRHGEKHPMWGRKGKDCPTSKKVVCLNTGKIFDSMAQASEYYGIKHASDIGQSYNSSKTFSCGKLENGEKLVWRPYDVYVTMTENEINEAIKKANTSNCGFNNKSSKSVICLTTKRIFGSIREGAKYYHCSDGEIVYCCQGFRMKKGKRIKVKSAGKLPDGTPLVWKKIIWNHGKRYRIKK